MGLFVNNDFDLICTHYRYVASLIFHESRLGKSDVSKIKNDVNYATVDINFLMLESDFCILYVAFQSLLQMQNIF